MLLFLHGFLGCKEDWEPLLSFLPSSFSFEAIDLPGHGSIPFEEDVALNIKKRAPHARILIGYSVGGRLALELKSRFPKDFHQVIAFSTHPGLQNENERKKRGEIDQKWIHLLREEPFDAFLEKWYTQDLFQSLKNSPHFDAILQRRKIQNPKSLAHFLEACSLAKKPPAHIDPKTIFVYGEEDLKYANLYHTLGNTIKGIKSIKVEKAGHAIHLENPLACAEIIKGVVYEKHH